MTFRQRCGLALVILSFVIWGCILLLPLTSLSAGDQGMWGGIIYGISYAVFFAGIALLGKEMWNTLKAKLRQRFRGGRDQGPPEP